MQSSYANPHTAIKQAPLRANEVLMTQHVLKRSETT